MKKGATFKENVEWLLNQYKKELEQEESDDTKHYGRDFSYINKEQMIWDYKNIIMELEMILLCSK